MDPLRAGFTPTLNAGVLGLGRFGYAVREVGKGWLQVPAVRWISSPGQEANNVFMWTLGDHYVLRIKRDPVEGVAEGTQRLFAQLPVAERPATVFLTWDINLDGKIFAPRFACIDEPKWTISLAALVAHASVPPVAAPLPTTPAPVVRSKITPAPASAKDDRQRDDG